MYIVCFFFINLCITIKLVNTDEYIIESTLSFLSNRTYLNPSSAVTTTVPRNGI